jgi:hypothetical protein
MRRKQMPRYGCLYGKAASAVFGDFRNVTAEDSYQKYLQKIHSSYFVVWNVEKTARIKCLAMKLDSEYLGDVEFDTSAGTMRSMIRTGMAVRLSERMVLCI